jgi:hypothetical protein
MMAHFKPTMPLARRDACIVTDLRCQGGFLPSFQSTLLRYWDPDRSSPWPTAVELRAALKTAQVVHTKGQ